MRAMSDAPYSALYNYLKMSDIMGAVRFTQSSTETATQLLHQRPAQSTTGRKATRGSVVIKPGTMKRRYIILLHCVDFKTAVNNKTFTCISYETVKALIIVKARSFQKRFFQRY